MNVISKLSQRQIVDVMIEYFTRHFKLLDMMDDIKDKWINMQSNNTKSNNTEYNNTEYNNTEYNNTESNKTESNKTKYKIFSRTYSCPSLESFKYTLEKLASFKLSYVIFYWIIAVFDDMLKKERFTLNGEVIHNFVILFYNMGSKLIEDVPYETSLFTEAINIEGIHGVYIEMYLMKGIISYSSPYTILWQKHIDYKLYCVIAHIVRRPIITIINIDKFDKDNKTKFYN